MKKRKVIMILKNTLFLFLGISFIGVAGIMIYVATAQIPDFKSFEARLIENSTKIYDRTGEVVLYDFHTNTKRTEIPFSEMGKWLPQATTAIEDSSFYTHNGVRPISIMRAILVNITSGKSKQGGSTITQQVIKNSLLTQDKSITRKIKEVVLAYKIETVFDKEQILELYINNNPYGGTVYGVKEGARMFFGKDPIDLTLAESAYMAAIPNAPTLYSPYRKNKAKLDERKNLVLNRMFELGIITEKERDEAKNEVVVFKPEQSTGIKAPHFVFFVQEYLEQKYGPDVIQTGGLNVITTLDYTLQKQAEDIVFRNAKESEKAYNASNQGLVSIDPKTGQILVMVGSRNYFDTDIDGAFNIATARRQPGSSFKPFIYETAFEKGYTPNTTVFDVPTEFSTSCTPYGKPESGHKKEECYMPSNFDDKSRGPITLRSALQESINVPAVKMLYLVGVDEALRKARSLGVNMTGDKSQYGLSLVLGGGEVSLLDITSAYGVFANEGLKNETKAILQIKSKDGEILEDFKENSSQVLNTQSVRLLNSVLSDNTARIPTFGANSALYIPGYDVAAKTGTTNNNRDAWLIGYTPNIVTGVWAGNNDNTSMKKGGAALAGPTWNEFMRFALSKRDNEKFTPPAEIPIETKSILRGNWQGGESFFIDKISGGLATEFTPNETKEEKIIPNVHSILHWVNKNDPTGEIPANPYNDSQYNNWETAVQNWWANNKNRYNTITPIKPDYYDNIHTPNNKPEFTVISPLGDYSIEKESVINVNVILTSNQLRRMDIFLNNVFVGSSNSNSYSFQPDENILENENILKIIVIDSNYNRSEKLINLLYNN